MSDYINYPRGSEWRKWDLHIHSNASDGKGTPREIIVKAKENGLSVIALTDHHTAKNVDLIREEGKKEGISVIAGIEFRSEYGQKSVHFIGLFPEYYNDTKLDSKALHDLILSPLNLSETAITSKGKEQDSSSQNEIAFKNGIFLVQVSFKQAADLIHQYGGIVSVHAGSKTNSLDEEIVHQGNGVRNTQYLYESLGTLKEELFKGGYIDICEIRKENDSEDFYLEKFNRPSIIASDAHEIIDVGSKFVWIKADPIFEGLKQIIYEPKERVKIQDEKPEQKNDYQVIDSILINHNDFFKQEILLNQNLNCIIGGRSSGKSLLLGCIPKKVKSNVVVKKGNKEYEDYLGKEIVPNVTLTWRDDGDSEERDVEYYPQSYINNLAADSIEVNKLIEITIKSDILKKNAIDTYNQFCIDNKSKINRLIGEYFALLTRSNEKKSEITAQGNKSGIQKEIEKHKEELKEIKKQLDGTISPDDENQYKKDVDNVEKKFALKESKEKSLIQLETIRSFTFFNEIDPVLIGFYEELKNNIRQKFSTIKQEFETTWITYIDDLVVNEKESIRLLEEGIQDINNNILFIKCKSYFNKNKTYSATEEWLKNEEKKLGTISQLETDFKALNDEMKTKGIEILKFQKEFYSKAEELVVKLGYTKRDVQISAFVLFKGNKFQESMDIRFDQRPSGIKDLVSFKYTNENDFDEFLNKIFNMLISDKIQFKSSFNLQQVLIDLFSENFFEIRYDVSYEKDKLSSMSEGKKAFIILRILLDFSERQCPILIDQPEDDLDNRAIYHDLVSYLKDKKKERQIILVTHNPNIVVGADAEEVIVANQHGTGNENQNSVKFEYLSGSLENTIPKNDKLPVLVSQGIREHVCDILEGGDEAFKQRERKYAIK